MIGLIIIFQTSGINLSALGLLGYELKNDVDKEKIDQNLEIIEEARKLICNLAEKYVTDMHSQSLQKAIAARKTKMWEILCDSKARKLKGFGEFPQRIIKEYDNDIDKQLAMVNKIIY